MISDRWVGDSIYNKALHFEAKTLHWFHFLLLEAFRRCWFFPRLSAPPRLAHRAVWATRKLCRAAEKNSRPFPLNGARPSCSVHPLRETHTSHPYKGVCLCFLLLNGLPVCIPASTGIVTCVTNTHPPTHHPSPPQKGCFHGSAFGCRFVTQGFLEIVIWFQLSFPKMVSGLTHLPLTMTPHPLWPNPAALPRGVIGSDA